MVAVLLKGQNSEEFFEEILAFLFQKGVANVLVEGGSFVWSSAFNRKKVSKLYLFQAPKIICQEHIMCWTKDIKINYLNLENMTITPLQEDLLIEGYTNPSNTL